MNGFKSFISALSSAMLFSGIVLILTPKTAKKQMQFVLSLIVISVLCSAVSCKHTEIKIPEPSSSYSVTEQLADVVSRQTVEAVLKENSVSYHSLEVYTDKNQNGSIFISRITLKTTNKEMDVAGMLKLSFPEAEVEAIYE